jgi:hypothetical protein
MTIFVLMLASFVAGFLGGESALWSITVARA